MLKTTLGQTTNKLKHLQAPSNQLFRWSLDQQRSVESKGHISYSPEMESCHKLLSKSSCRKFFFLATMLLLPLLALLQIIPLELQTTLKWLRAKRPLALAILSGQATIHRWHKISCWTMSLMWGRKNSSSLIVIVHTHIQQISKYIRM